MLINQLHKQSTTAGEPAAVPSPDLHISKPDRWPTGKYQVELFLDGRSVETKKFEVKAN